MKPNGKSPITSDYDEKVMFFRDVSPGPHETQLRFRLIHFWEAWNPLKKTLIGLEMLLIDEQTVPPLLMKTDSDFIPLRIFKLTAIAKETSTTPVLDEVEIARARHVLVHVQSHDGPVMKLYLWDQAARDFCKKFKSYENTPTVLLVTTVNTKSLGGTLALTSMSSSRVFMGYDVQPTIDYFDWLSSNPQSAEQVDEEVVTKRETLTIGEIFSYIKQGATKEAFFECTATIDDVVHGSTWYRAQISVYDNSEQAVFVCLVMLANGNQGVTQEVPMPEALISTIGQKHNFCVKVTKHNLEGKSRSLTVTKILPLDTPAATESSEETFETGANVCEASKVNVDSAEEIKRTCGIDEMGNAKRLKDSSSRLKRRVKVSSASRLRTDTEITIESVYQALINAKLQPTDNRFDSKDQNTKGMENPPPPPPSQTA
uniref:Replication factor A C-terminal domain-containing protein n=1 Tax=Brassica oleracea var. oleracea TaxID=109376 RepID=A0A0D3ACH3_BRAOL